MGTLDVFVGLEPSFVSPSQRNLGSSTMFVSFVRLGYDMVVVLLQ